MEQDNKENEIKDQEGLQKDLKRIAIDLYNSKIFSDRHLLPNDMHMLPSIFLPIMLGALSSKTPKELEEEIGMIYEYIDKAGPRGINGYPCFFSFRILTPQETEEMLKYYAEYKKFIEDFAGKQDNP